MSVDQIRALLQRITPEERQEVLQVLRREHNVAIHPIEIDWRTSGESILEAIYAAPDLTQRGVRGVLAEAIFRTNVVPLIGKWKSIVFAGDLPYDVLMSSEDGEPALRVQVKNQRREKGVPKVDAKLTKQLGLPIYVVETQRTRTGKRTDANGAETATRPYRFGEFDVLAVCLQPSSGNWEEFVYCPSHMLVPRSDNQELLAVMQPIYTEEVSGWTRDFAKAAAQARAHMATRD
ncbi:hypothetical protein [Stenotrophomonas bentonitica]|uniref:hypothetical protein n=1 Tax=Stenotrophomonas bentonitica TaxID=1450134 RepID=UPI00345E1407